MDTLSKIILLGLSLIVTIQIIYSYFTFSSFKCPICPACPKIKENPDKIPNNLYITNFIYNYFINKITDDVNSLDYINKNIIFANKIKVKYDQDAEIVMSKLKNELITNKKNIVSDNLKFVQSSNIDKINEFNKLYNLSIYPSPLIFFKNSKILFGWIETESKWKMLINRANF